MKRIPKRYEQEAARALPDNLQSFLKEHALRMNAEGDQRRVMVSAVVVQSFMGMHAVISQAVMQGAILNANAMLAAGGSFAEAVDPDGILDATRFAYEFLAACSALVLREATASLGGDADAFPELDAFVAAFRIKRWGDPREEASVN